MTMENSVNTEKIVQDLKVVVADAEELLRATASQAGERATLARAKIEQSLERARVKLSEVESLVAWFLVPARVSLGSAPGLRDRMTGKSQNGA